MGLRKELNNWIRDRGEVAYFEIEHYCKMNKYKMSNAERCLRPSISPQVEAVKNIKHCITGYKWIGSRMELETKLAFKEANDNQKQSNFL